MGTAQQRSAGSPSTSGRHQVTPRPQASIQPALQQLYPKRVGGGYDFIEDTEANPLCAPGAVSQALRALPAHTHPYSQYDLDLLAEILRHGDAQAHKEACSGSGSGEVSPCLAWQNKIYSQHRNIEHYCHSLHGCVWVL